MGLRRKGREERAGGAEERRSGREEGKNGRIPRRCVNVESLLLVLRSQHPNDAYSWTGREEDEVKRERKRDKEFEKG